MPKLAADLGLLWSGLPFLDRFYAAAEAGFEGVFVPSPYNLPARDIRRALLTTGLTLVQITAPPPGYTDRPRGFAATEGGEDRFHHDLRRAFRYSAEMRVPLLRVLAGAGSEQTLRQNLRTALNDLPAGIRLVIGFEEDPASVLADADLALRMTDEINHPSLLSQETVDPDEIASVTAGAIARITRAPDAGNLPSCRADWVCAAWQIPDLKTANFSWVAAWKAT